MGHANGDGENDRGALKAGKTKADPNNAKEKDEKKENEEAEETSNTQRVETHNQLGVAQGLDDQQDKATERVNPASKKKIENMKETRVWKGLKLLMLMTGVALELVKEPNAHEEMDVHTPMKKQKEHIIRIRWDIAGK